ncbi:hypothetical protein ACFSC2_00905 [Flavobacterium artemisiae]|uniref:Lipoprotein n=2 Tax=Flavobacterium artemisiae TaxID=2126556 RepID=A0ABW4H860_9FLAO
MIRKRNKKITFIILIITVLFSCQNKAKIQVDKNENIKTNKINDDIKLIEDLNFDNYPDTLKIKNLENGRSILSILLSGKNTPIVSNEIIFPIGELYSQENKNSITVSCKKKTVVLVQEYGSASPDGWYTCYINYNKEAQKFYVDSITNSWKNYNAKSDIDFIKSRNKLIKKDLENFNSKLEFYNFN